MTETYNLRLQLLGLSVKDIYKICNERGRKIGYSTCCRLVRGEHLLPKTHTIIETTLKELESERKYNERK